MSDKTIKELAEELNVSKTAINKKVNDELKRKHFSKIANKFVVDEKGQSIIASMFKKEEAQTETKTNSRTKSQTENREVIDLLKQQVTNQTQQLNQKDEQIEKLQNLLDQQQILTLQANKKIEQLEYQSEEKEEIVSQPAREEKTNWFSKWFK